MSEQLRPVRVLTWNLWWRFGPWQQRRDAIAAVLGAAQPDLCGLQEVWASPGDHLAAVLADRLGMHWAWTPSPAPERWQQRIGDQSMQLGNAILSRWPITEQASQRLPAAADDDADEVRLLGGHKTAPVVPGLVLVDAWRYADPWAPGWTWDRRNPYVAATGEPSARIDYVLVGLPAASGAGRVRSVRLVGDWPVDGVWPSDHAGVLAELQPARDPAR